MRIYSFKRLFILFLLFNSAILFAQNESTQYDDIYFDGVEKVQKKAANPASGAQDRIEDELFDDEIAASETVPEGTMPEEYYIDENLEPHDYEYASRVRRFHDAAPGFSYYSNYYTDNYWYNNNQSQYYGSNIYTNPNYGHYYGWGNSYYSGWNNHNQFHQPYAFGYNNNWNNWGWNNPYCSYNNYYGNNNSNWNNYNANSNYWWYNFANSSPNAGNYVMQRSRRGSDVVRSNTVHLSRQPDSRMTTESIRRNRNAVSGPRPSATNITAPSTNSTNSIRNTRRPNVANSGLNTTGVRSNTGIRTNTRNSYNSSSSSGRVNTRTNPSTNATRSTNTTRTYPSTPSNYGTRPRSTYTPNKSNSSSRSSSSSSRSGSNRSNSSSSSSNRNSSRPR